MGGHGFSQYWVPVATLHVSSNSSGGAFDPCPPMSTHALNLKNRAWVAENGIGWEEVNQPHDSRRQLPVMENLNTGQEDMVEGNRQTSSA